MQESLEQRIERYKEMRKREQFAGKLLMYYREVFPSESIYKWLLYGYHSDMFKRREFAFTVKSGAFVRHQAYVSCDAFRAGLLKEVPFSLYIGAAYNMNARRKKVKTFAPCEKELVFDVDITDYNGVRNCCSSAQLCAQCWKYMEIACRVLDAALREDFGFQHLLWVYSGRRGIHCWVCDDFCRRLSADVRSAIADYLQLITGGVFSPKKVNLEYQNIHYSVSRAVNIIDEYFPSICLEEQDILGSNTKIDTFLAIFEDEEAVMLRDRLLAKKTSKERWEEFVDCVQEMRSAGKLKEKYRHIETEIKLQYLYPRLDVTVTKSVSHLLRCPFSIHPDTGNICMPFDPRNIGNFSPFRAPNINQVLSEMSEIRKLVTAEVEVSGKPPTSDASTQTPALQDENVQAGWRDVPEAELFLTIPGCSNQSLQTDCTYCLQCNLLKGTDNPETLEILKDTDNSETLCLETSNQVADCISSPLQEVNPNSVQIPRSGQNNVSIRNNSEKQANIIETILCESVNVFEEFVAQLESCRDGGRRMASLIPLKVHY